jgi:hypothetical protein
MKKDHTDTTPEFPLLEGGQGRSSDDLTADLTALHWLGIGLCILCVALLALL